MLQYRVLLVMAACTAGSHHQQVTWLPAAGSSKPMAIIAIVWTWCCEVQLKRSVTLPVDGMADDVISKLNRVQCMHVWQWGLVSLEPEPHATWPTWLQAAQATATRSAKK
jgi:hypothetical protein